MKTSSARKSILQFWGVVALGQISALAVDFELSGKAIFENFKPDGSPLVRASGLFTIQSSDRKWVIGYFPDNTATAEQTMYDGVDVYTLTYNLVVDKSTITENPELEKLVRSSNGVAYATASAASVYSGDYPYGAKSLSRLLWLAFLSGSDLAKPQTAPIPAPWMASYLPEARSFRLNAEWPLPKSEFPATVRFVSSSELWSNAMREWKFAKQVTEAPPLQEGFVAGIYEVTEWKTLTNRGATLAFPAKCRLDRYYPPGGRGKAVVSESYLCEVSTVRILPTSVGLGPLDLKEDTYVLDFRFQTKDLPWFYVAYPITNRAWKTTNDPTVTSLIAFYKTNFIAARSLPPYPKRAPDKPRRYALVVLLVTLACLPAALLIRRVSRKTR